MSDPTAEGAEIADLLAPYWTERKVIEALGLTERTLSERLAGGTLLGLVPSDGDARHYPVFQFQKTRDGTVRVKSGLVPFLQTLLNACHDPWTVGITLMTPMEELDARTPLDWLRGGGAPEALQNLAEILVREWR